MARAGNVRNWNSHRFDRRAGLLPMAAARRATCQSGLAPWRESIMYACKIKETAMAAGAALAAKRGKKSKSSLKGPSRQMAKSMSKTELRKMAKTKRKGKPTRKRKKR